jgi:serine/threonine-protein kinase
VADAPLVGRPRTGLWPSREAPDGRSVTVRRARPGIVADAEVRRELAREARILAQIGPHEAILALLADESAADPPRLVLEGGELVPLERVLAAAEPPLGVAAALALVVPLAEAVGEAHARGIVHGGIAPQVVLVTSRGTPKLTGWADARAPGTPPPDAPDTPLRSSAWLAPELIMGEPAGAAADVHALGALFALLAVGRRPAAGPVRAREVGTRPRAAAPGPEVAPGLPPDLARVVARAVSRHPADRHETAADLALALAEAAPGPFDHGRVAAELGRRGLSATIRPRGAAPAAATIGSPAPSALPFVAVLAGLLVWAAGVELLAGGPPDPVGAPGAPASGHLRVLAQPWAHVAIDGEPVDTTPIGAPIEVTPGRHVVDLEHPQAPKAQRVVEVRPGQTVVVDVILDVPKPVVDAGIDASP